MSVAAPARAARRHPARLPVAWLLAAIAFTLAAAAVAVTFGPASVPPSQVAKALLDLLPGVEVDHGLHGPLAAVITEVRLPRVVLAGLTSIADAAPDAAGGYPQLSAESVLAADPVFVFLAHSDGTTPTPDELAARPGWSELQAVRDGHVVVLDPDVASRWGPRVVDLLAAVVAATAATT